MRDKMTEKDKSIEQRQDIIATRVAQMIAKRGNITPTEAIRKLMNSQTYGLLLEPESYLHFESAEYVLFMYDAEQRGDWELWTKI
jgi:hypothetical protein